MRQLTNECPEVLELSAQTDTFASVFSALASLQDPAISSREQVQQKAQEAAMLLSQINETFASLMAA
ncbi:hypothetical protein OAL13_00105 [bacterium]|nr:hypothetical protein [bacterium]